MKRRDIIRNAAAGGLLVTGVGSAQVADHGSDSTVYRLENTGDGFKVVDTFDGGGVGPDHHFYDGCGGCCAEKCCDCDSSCGACTCHERCDDIIVE